MAKLNRKLVARRDFLARLGGVAVAYSFASLASLPGVASAAAERVRTVRGNVTWPKGKTIPAGHRLRFNPKVSTTVTVSGGHVIVEGVLEMRPAAPGVVHTLRFTNINEAAFVGGGNVVVASDRGLWVVGDGLLDVQGTAKIPWARTAEAISVGQTTVLLDRDPVGWRVGDQVTIVPTEPPSVPKHWTHYDGGTITAISGRSVTLNAGCTYPHPTVTIPANAKAGFPGVTYGAEVLNLTRDCRIEGMPGKRSHVFMHSTQPQVLKYLEMAHLGPRRLTPDGTDPILGRWPVHFHHGCDDSLIEGVVVRDSGSHAFVAHDSDRVVHRGCIAHRVFGDPYWWDLETAEDQSRFVRYENCVASMVQTDPPERGFRLAGFQLGGADGNSITGCVAVGVQGNKDASGFKWPEAFSGAWDFDKNLSHNNARHGIFVWQNNGVPHSIKGFVGYHNGGAGISHGAYKNGASYENCALWGNGGGSVILHALSRATRPFLRFVGVAFNGPLRSVKHSLAASFPILFKDCSLTGVRIDDGDGKGSVYDFVNCDPLEPFNFSIVRLQPNGRIRVQRKDGTAFQIDPSGTKAIPRFDVGGFSG
jgi:hypothetical protein